MVRDPSQDLRLRSFGTTLEDLEVDLASGDRARAVTDVLAACARPARDADFFWDLPISTRTAWLLRLALLDGASAIDVDFRCLTCSQPLEISLAIEELLGREGEAVESIALVGDEGSVTELRRPTGRDQAEWAAAAFADERAWRRTIVARLTTGTVPDEGAFERIEQALDEADPLLRATVSASCPDCAAVSHHDVDLTACALDRLARAQQRLIHAIHTLASRYHWSEADILALPPWRRDRYLSLLGQESIS